MKAVGAGGIFGDELGECKKPGGRIGLEEALTASVSC